MCQEDWLDYLARQHEKSGMILNFVKRFPIRDTRGRVQRKPNPCLLVPRVQLLCLMIPRAQIKETEVEKESFVGDSMFYKSI